MKNKGFPSFLVLVPFYVAPKGDEMTMSGKTTVYL